MSHTLLRAKTTFIKSEMGCRGKKSKRSVNLIVKIVLIMFIYSLTGKHKLTHPERVSLNDNILWDFTDLYEVWHGKVHDVMFPSQF